MESLFLIGSSSFTDWESNINARFAGIIPTGGEELLKDTSRNGGTLTE